MSWAQRREAESPGLNKCLKNKAPNSLKDFPHTELRAEKGLLFLPLLTRNKMKRKGENNQIPKLWTWQH